MSLRILFFAVVTILASVVQLLASSTTSVGASFSAAVVTTVISHALWRFIDLDSKQRVRELIPAGGALAGVAVGIVLRLVQADLNPWTWAAVPAAILTSGVFMWAAPQRRSG